MHARTDDPFPCVPGPDARDRQHEEARRRVGIPRRFVHERVQRVVLVKVQLDKELEQLEAGDEPLAQRRVARRQLADLVQDPEARRFRHGRDVREREVRVVRRRGSGARAVPGSAGRLGQDVFKRGGRTVRQRPRVARRMTRVGRAQNFFGRVRQTGGTAPSS